MGLRGPGARPALTKKITGKKPSTPWKQKRSFGPKRAEVLIKWIEQLPITSGVHAGRKFKLREWQKAIIRDIYKTDDTGKRVVSTALITMGRKNGKTALAAVLALAHLAGPEAEQRGQVYSAAADREQAALIYREMKAIIEYEERFDGQFIIRDFLKTIEHVPSGSIYHALSSDARKAHGLSPSFYIADELAQWPKRDLYDDLSSGTGARAEPLGIVISTQSADPFSVMSEMVKYGEQIKEGSIEDASFSAHIFTVPLNANPWDESLWPLANPALGDFLSIDKMRTDALQAQRIPAREAAFRNLYLNQPVEPDERFIHARDWDALGEPFDLTELKGEECVAGLDLGSAGDLCGLALWFPKKHRLLAWGFIPSGQIVAKENTDRAPYQLWRDQGVMIATPGKAINKAWVAHKLREISQDYQLRAVAFDRWGFADLENILDVKADACHLCRMGRDLRTWGPVWKSLNDSC